MLLESSFSSWALLGLLCLVVSRLILSLLRASRLGKMMPPGPPGLPFIGNLLQLPRRFQWLRFTEWKEQYGSIYSLNLAGQRMIVLNDFMTAADFLDRRSGIYSDRPRFIMTSEILTGSMALPFLAYGNRWRRMRRAAHDGFNVRASATYQVLQEKESILLASHFLRDPARWGEHFGRSAASTVLSAVYGWPPIDTSADALVERIDALTKRAVNASAPGAHLVEILPSMLCLPEWLAKWKREGREWFRKDSALFEGFFDEVEMKLKTGRSEPCFAASLIEGEERYNLDKQEAAWLAGTMFGAGAETTAAALSVFMLSMTLYPDAVRLAQAHIDSVVGRERMPTFGDRSKLPYIDAIVKEVLRWRPVGPIGLPRRSTQDDWYKGYFIPKGSLVLYNVWAVNRDPTYFPDFDEFRPERYLNESGELADPIPDTHVQGHLSYGSGRRVCVGKEVANQALFIDIATLLWAFDIGKAVDEDGQIIVPSRTDVVDNGLTVRPEPFKCSIAPRSPDVANLINSNAAALETTRHMGGIRVLE